MAIAGERVTAGPVAGGGPADGGSELSTRTAVGLCIIFAAAGTVVRLLPCFDNFWLDEIWSYFAVRELTSPLGVFTSIHHSNNNHLYTLLMYALGDQRQWAVYRIPSLLAGIGAIWLAARIAWRRGRVEAILAAFLTSFCFALIHFSSEARGYSLAVFFALAAYDFLERDLDAPRRLTTLGFALSVILGYLSHLSYLFFYAGAGIWSATRVYGKGGDTRRSGKAGPGAARSKPGSNPMPIEARPAHRISVRHLIELHALPVFVLVLLYVIDLRRMEIGGGDRTPLMTLLSMTIGYTLGSPVGGAFAIPAALAAAALLGGGLLVVRRERNGAWVLHLVAIVLAPVLILVVAHPVVIALRYFLVPIALFLLLLAFLLARLYRRGGRSRAAGLVLLALFLVGNGWHTRRFLQYGRGGYLPAFRYMADHTRGRQVLTGFDNDFRSGIVARFYSRYLPAGKELLYYAIGQWPRQGPEWVIIHRIEEPKEPHAEMTDPSGNRYALAAEYPCGGISGFYWAVYHNLGTGAPPPGGIPSPGAPR